MTISCPCYDCNDRTGSCHGSCSAYIEWNEQRLIKKGLRHDPTQKAYNDYVNAKMLKKRKR